MKKNSTFSILISLLFLLMFNNCNNIKNSEKTNRADEQIGTLLVGWSSVDITPENPVPVQGQFAARVSEGVLDPLTATVFVLESVNEATPSRVIFVSCDIIEVSNDLHAAIQDRVKILLPEIKPEEVIINATHTHTAPDISANADTKTIYGIELDAMSPAECIEYIAEKIVYGVMEAWENRRPGGISYGLGHAVVGYNRLSSDFSGKSEMYDNLNKPEFSHIEGFEDHSVNLIYTWDEKSNLTGVVINIPCPSQVTETLHQLSADFWHETRLEVQARLGKDIFILPQSSAAGDQSPHFRIGEGAELRMQQLMFPEETEIGDFTVAHRKQIAIRIADAVSSVYKHVNDKIDWNPVLKNEMKTVDLTRRLMSMKDVEDAVKETKEWTGKYEQLLQEINDPNFNKKGRWYAEITQVYTRVKRGVSVKERYELEKIQPKMPINVHVVRIGDIVLATNPFELYLDYGIRIKARSAATQTFVIQLSNGNYGYLPTSRSIAGGAYGAEPASTYIGPEGGQELVEETLNMIDNIMKP